MHVRLGDLVSIAFVAVVLAACGGGSGNLVIVPTSAPASSPAAQLMPTIQSTTAAVTTAGGTINLPGVSNGKSNVISSAKVTIPALTAAGTAAASLSALAPAGISAPSVKHRDALGVANVPLAFIVLTFQQNETLNASPGFSVTVPAGVTIPAGNAYVVVSSPALSGGWNEVSGPVTVSGSTLTFASAPLAPPLTIQAGIPYIFAIVTTGSLTIATPAPTPAPAIGATYTGSKTIGFTYGYAFGYPSAPPTAPPGHTSYAVTSTVSIGSSPNPGSVTGTSDEHTVENDVSSLSTMTLNTDAWIGAVSGNPVLYAMTQTEPSSANEPTTTTTYTTPQILDELPEANGAIWTTNSPQSSVAYSYANGDNGTRVVAADGSYTDTENILAGGTGGQAVLTENAGGSGSITGPFYDGGIINSITMGAPTGGNVVVTFNYSTFAQTEYGYPPSEALSDPTWYATPPVFYAETDSIATAPTLPQPCANSYGTAGNDVHRSIVSLDTVIGDVETTTFDTYVVNGLPVCLVSNDVVSYAYDLQNNTPFTLLYGQLGLEVQTTAEVLVMQPGAVGPLASSRIRAASSSSTSAGPMLALEAHQLAGFQRVRAQHDRAFVQSIRSTTSKPVAAHQGGRS